MDEMVSKDILKRGIVFHEGVVQLPTTPQGRKYKSQMFHQNNSTSKWFILS